MLFFSLAFEEWRRLPWEILQKSSHVIWHPGQQHERQLIHGTSYRIHTKRFPTQQKGPYMHLINVLYV